MAALFLDASAVVKRYIIAEAHMQQIRRACAPSTGNVLILARHTSVEIASALARRVREGVLLPHDQERLWQSVNQHWTYHYQIVPASEQVFQRAEALVVKHPLRAADAVQIASALLVAAGMPDALLRFWTADRRQAAAARAEGLDVELLT